MAPLTTDSSSFPPLGEDETGRLIAAARAAAANAHAPYSNFPVGAAVLTDSGQTISGCNVENASYGLTICAERNAVAAAVASGAKRLRAIAVFTHADSPTPPCGACRQVLAEFGDDAMEVISANQSGDTKRWRLGELLPDAFRFTAQGPTPPGAGAKTP